MVKQLQAFLGFGNFYRWFIWKFSKIAMPLNGLLKKNVPFELSLECQEAFLTLKQRFMEEPVLLMPNQTWPFQIESDASKYASGAVLTQTDSNGDRHLVAFMSKTFYQHRTVIQNIWQRTFRHYPMMRSHYLWPRKSQNRTIPVNLEAIWTTTIASKLF